MLCDVCHAPRPNAGLGCTLVAVIAGLVPRLKKYCLCAQSWGHRLLPLAGWLGDMSHSHVHASDPPTWNRIANACSKRKSSFNVFGTGHGLHLFYVVVDLGFKEAVNTSS